MKFRDYYQIMGLARDASQDDIKRAYRKLARKYHPDVSKEADAEARFKELGEAYEVLKDPEKRAAYDRLGSNWRAGQDFRPPPDWDQGFEFSGRGFSGAGGGQFSDFFETLFGGSFGPGAGFGQAGGAHFHARGEDSHARIAIDLEDAYHGASRSIKLSHSVLGGDGRPHLAERSLDVKIPKGVRQGSRIRLAGQGGAGRGRGPAGDLYLEIEFRPHPLYRVEGRDVYLDLPLAPWEAALGASVPAPTPGGQVSLKIPAGSSAGRKLRLAGRGIPGQPPGDFYAVLQIALPPADSEAARAFYERMAAELPFAPRARLGV
jgi:curved DNA-binding protein